MSAPFTIPVRVRYAECDMQGRVFNAHYLTWFDMAHAALMSEALGRPIRELIETGIDVVVAECGIRYLAPAEFDDELLIGVALEPAGTTSMTSRFKVTRSGELITEGFIRHVCFDLNAMQKRPWPEELRAGFGRYTLTAPP
jgi:acyl-CoA thioester hydrolase